MQDLQQTTNNFFIKTGLFLSILIFICVIICQNTNIISSITNQTLQNILLFTLVIGGLIYFFTFLTTKTEFETFVDKIEEEKKNYMKFKETYMPMSKNKASLDVLYANYTGDDIAKQEVWENKTLAQCFDSCNKLQNCVGFSRDAVNDDENGNCYPKTEVSNVHSTRKGTYNQRQEALKYNSYIKSNIPNVLNLAVGGDVNLTLNRKIYLKSVKFADSCIGVVHNNVQMIDVNTNSGQIKDCQFMIEPGLFGGDTISFKHMMSGYYLYRDNKNNIVLFDIKPAASNSLDKQRASFNMLDGINGSSIKLATMKLEGEKMPKYVSINSTNPSNKYLYAIPKESEKDKQLMSFEMIDNIIVTGIVNELVKVTPHSSSNALNGGLTVANPQNLVSASGTSASTASANYLNIKNASGGNSEKFANLDNSKDNLLFDAIIADNPSRKKIDVENYMEDNYLKSYEKTESNNLQNKYNNILLNSGNSEDHYKKKLQNLKELNMEIEKELEGKTGKIQNINNNMTNSLNRMRLTDMASDLFFLKNLENKNK